MKIAVLSDVHANAHALRAVLADAERLGVAAVWHLGDAVDRGGEPDTCVRLLDEHADENIAGNHDLLVAGKASDIDRLMFGDEWLENAGYTRQAMSPAALDMLAALPPERRIAGDRVHLAHGSPRDPVWEFVDSHAVAHAALQVTDAQVVLVGHTHEPLAFRYCPDRPDRIHRHAPRLGMPVTLGEERWVLNPGSVGAPRWGQPRDARWMLWDRATDTVVWHRSEYDWEAAELAALDPPPPVGTYR